MTGSTDGHGSPRGAETTGRIVVALFEERSGAEDAIRDLKNAGFTDEQIGVATQDRVGAGEARSEGSSVDDEPGRKPQLGWPKAPRSARLPEASSAGWWGWSARS
jgi:hypothetical protein